MTSARDIIVSMVVLFVSSIIIFVLAFVSNQINGQLQATSVINASTQAAAAMNSGLTTVANSGDYMIFGVYIGITLATLISAYFVAANPIFAFIYIIMVIIGVSLSTVLSNVYGTFTATAVFGSTNGLFPIANQLMTYFPHYIAVLGFIGLVILFNKPQKL